MEYKKYLWFTDTHFNRVYFWNLIKFFLKIRKENPVGIFLTGDISDGKTTIFYLKLLASLIKIPIYFILGNHDLYFSSFDKTFRKIRKTCGKYSNLIWMTESELIFLNQEVGLIGVDGWYDARLGNPSYLAITIDWVMIKDFRELSNMDERIEAFRNKAKKSVELLEKKLIQALDKFKTVYILTHMPPWKQATRDEGTLLESFYLPYNVNLGMGEMIEKIMKNNSTKNVVILTGHTHHPEFIRVSKNIFCQVGEAGIKSLNSQKIYI